MSARKAWKPRDAAPRTTRQLLRQVAIWTFEGKPPGKAVITVLLGHAAGSSSECNKMQAPDPQAGLLTHRARQTLETTPGFWRSMAQCIRSKAPATPAAKATQGPSSKALSGLSEAEQQLSLLEAADKCSKEWQDQGEEAYRRAAEGHALHIMALAAYAHQPGQNDSGGQEEVCLPWALCRNALGMCVLVACSTTAAQQHQDLHDDRARLALQTARPEVIICCCATAAVGTAHRREREEPASNLLSTPRALPFCSLTAPAFPCCRLRAGSSAAADQLRGEWASAVTGWPAGTLCSRLQRGTSAVHPAPLGRGFGSGLPGLYAGW